MLAAVSSNCSVLHSVWITIHSEQKRNKKGSCQKFYSLLHSTIHSGASLVAQWSRIHLPMQEMWVQPLGGEDPLG